MTRKGNQVIADLDSHTFHSGLWDEVTGGIEATQPLEATLRALDPRLTLEIRIDGVRLCAWADGLMCSD